MNKAYYDVAVIGGGILGTFVARNIRRWNLSTVLIEAEDDVCKGITRANTAIVYTGCDNRPGSLKAQLTVAGNRAFGQLCEELDVPFSRCGSLLVVCESQAEKILHKKYKDGIQNGVLGMQLLTGDEVRSIEPMISDNVIAGLYVPDTGTVNPWQLGIAACENAVANGCRLLCNEQVMQIEKAEDGYIITTNNTQIVCRAIVNCAGLSAEQIHNMVYELEVYLEMDGSDYLVLDKHAAMPSHIVFQETATGKGVTAVPCTEGNLLLESPARALTVPFATTMEGIQYIKEAVQEVLPEVNTSQTIRSFAAVRPNICTNAGENISDFYIASPAPDFISLIGVKTPGLTCADTLGLYIAERIAGYLQAEVNETFQPRRKKISKKDHQIVCLCENITRGEILEAIERGAVSVDGVKRRVGSGMGRCQGSRCAFAIGRMLEEAKHGTI